MSSQPKKSQKNSERWHLFRRRKYDIHAPRFTTQSTTLSPQNHHTKTSYFVKPPEKTPLPSPAKKYGPAKAEPHPSV
jgi:hypothetical protein